MTNKSKIKLSLIDDYIKIISIKNLFKNTYFQTLTTQSCVDLLTLTQKLDQYLEIIYNALFEKLKLKNISLDILNNELKENNSIFLSLKQNKFSNLENILNSIYSDLKNISNTLKEKTDKLKVNFQA